MAPGNHKALKVFYHEAQIHEDKQHFGILPSSPSSQKRLSIPKKLRCFPVLAKVPPAAGTISQLYLLARMFSVLGTQTWQTLQSQHSSKHSHLLLKFSVLGLSKTAFLTFTKVNTRMLSSVKNVFFIDTDLVFWWELCAILTKMTES